MQKYKKLNIQRLTLLRQLIVPLLSEASDKRDLEILIEGLALRLPFGDSATADIPLVVVDSLKLSEILYSDRIEMTGYGLGEIGFAIAVSLFDSTEGYAVFDNGIGTFATVDKWSARQFVDIYCRDALALDYSDAFGGHIRFDNRIDAFENGNLVSIERGSTVAVDTAGALALLDVAAETDISQIIRNDAIVNN